MLGLVQVWIVGILGLSVFWCMISLLAISRLEKRLPSEMQEQLEFHATFSGLWPRQQPGTLGARRPCPSCLLRPDSAPYIAPVT